MGGKSTLISTFALANTKQGKVTISHIEEPYGKDSTSVVSIGISLKGEKEPDWKAHIPYENLDELIKALQSAKKTAK